MTSGSRRLLWIAWAVTFALSLVCAGVFVYGMVRDTRPFDPVLRVDLSAPSDWISAPFRVWGDEEYVLLIRSVNHDPARSGRPLTAAFDVRVLTPDGEPVLERSYAAGQTGHAIPNGYGDARLGSLRLSDWPLRPWVLQVRVTEPDPAFAAVPTDVELYENRSDPGMGGLVSYAMFFPAAGLMLLALIVAIPLARHGSRLPLIVAGIGSALFLLFVG